MHAYQHFIEYEIKQSDVNAARRKYWFAWANCWCWNGLCHSCRFVSDIYNGKLIQNKTKQNKLEWQIWATIEKHNSNRNRQHNAVNKECEYLQCTKKLMANKSVQCINRISKTMGLVNIHYSHGKNCNFLIKIFISNLFLRLNISKLSDWRISFLIFKTPPQMAFSVSMEKVCNVCLCVKWMKRQRRLLCVMIFDLKLRFERVNDTLGSVYFICVCNKTWVLWCFDTSHRNIYCISLLLLRQALLPVNRKNKQKYWFVLVEPTVLSGSSQAINQK